MNKQGHDRSESWSTCRFAPLDRVLRVGTVGLNFRIEGRYPKIRSIFLPNTCYRARRCISLCPLQENWLHLRFINFQCLYSIIVTYQENKSIETTNIGRNMFTFCFQNIKCLTGINNGAEVIRYENLGWINVVQCSKNDGLVWWPQKLRWVLLRIVIGAKNS
jgi:hypothetical protein